MNQSDVNQYDCIIIGGGVIGLLCAHALAQLELSICVIEKYKYKDLCLEETDSRVFALNHASINVLQNLSLWQSCQSKRVSPYTQMKVFDAHADGAIAFDCNARLEEMLGVIVEQKVLLDSLVDAMKKNPNIKLLCEEQVQQIDSAMGLVTLSENKILHGSYIIGADGGQSWVRKQTPIKLSAKSYNQKAIVATLVCEKPHHQTARQYFHPSGPVALLPLKNPNEVSLVWSADSEKSDKLLNMDSDKFVSELELAVKHVAGKMTLRTVRRSFPLSKQLANKYIYQKVILIGDAAHVVHPLAGQGMNLGIMDVALLFDTFKQLRDGEKSHGSRLLNRYQRHRRAHAQALIMAMDAFYNGFKSRNIDLISLRNWGLSGVNSISTIKNIFVDIALGKIGYTIPNLGRNLDGLKFCGQYGTTNRILQ